MEPDTSCKITPINVGSGDSILVQVHGEHGYEHYLIDGGPKTYITHVENCLNYYNLIKMWVVEGKPVLQCNIIVTHPDLDHFSGITQLMKKYYIAGEIIITKAFERKCRSKQSTFLQEFYSELTSTHSPDLESSWSPASWQPLSPTGIICCQSPEEKCLRYVPHAQYLYYPSCTKNWGSNRDWNKSSILTAVRKPNTEYAAVLTGDSYGNIVLSHFNLLGKHTQIFQVPHHGSKKNIEVGKEGTLDMCTDLYSKFTAGVYVISGNDMYHPHAEILSGILKAAYQKDSESEFEAPARKIVLTGSHGLSAEKIIKSTHMPTGRDYQTFLQRKMQIIHIDDIGIFCKHNPLLVPRPFITISVSAGSDDCKVLGGVPWTPETYYTEEWKSISCPCKKYKTMDAFGWTTSFEHDTPEIDRFYGIKLLKVPFHEEPWQGAGNHRYQQYVYIVAATLGFHNYRQVLYLKEIKSAHNKLYEMFAYSDLCWTRKYVPRIFQLTKSTTFRPMNHYDRRLDAYIYRLYSTQ
jgi:beta-lactamase superfamily II metal-dependent hydrolase